MACRRGLRRFSLLLWKNWLLRKRKSCCTILEAVLPLCAVFIFIIFQLIGYYVAPTVRSFHGETTWELSTPSRYPHAATEQDMLSITRMLLVTPLPKFLISISKGKKTVTIDPSAPLTTPLLAYAPHTPLTEEIIREALLILGEPKIVHQSYNSIAEVDAAAKKQFIAFSDSSTDVNKPAGDKIVAAIIFGRGTKGDKAWATTKTFPVGKTAEYTIRMAQQVSVDDKPGSRKISEETRKYYLDRNAGEIDNVTHNYLQSGFSGLQIAIDKAIIKVITGQEVTQKIDTAGFPYTSQLRSSEKGFGFGLYTAAFPILLISGFVPLLVFIIVRISAERTSGINELMKMTGLPSWMHWLAWMINTLVLSSITMAGLVLFLFIPFCGKDGGFIKSSHLSLWWFVFFVSIFAIATFGFFISSLFETGVISSFVAFFIWIVPYVGIVAIFGMPWHTATFTVKMATSLLPPVALHWAVVILCSLQAAGTLNYGNANAEDLTMRISGAYWENMALPLDDISIGYCVLMLVVDTVLYMCLTLYLENVMPGEYGVRKPFYFIFMPSTWIESRNRVVTVNSDADPAVELKSGYETEPSGLSPIVDVKDLTKRFGKQKIAVKQISFKMYEGQITVLLGHNGAGKTTAMSMITGLLAPTSGTAIVNGLDLNKDMNQVRDSMGLCPQHNMLFDRLTVTEHLKFFGLLKGLTFEETEVETKKCLEKLRFEDKKNAMSKDLSGGQKRKLCLGMALIGNTKLLVLDEPSSGMDPETRRAIWDVLLEIREGRTILLTTHFMEEADALGDRIIIMAEGEVKCCGSQLFLKKLYGAGYTVKFTTLPDTNTDNIVQTVQKHIPKASIKDQKSTDELAMTIPSENDVNSIFPRLFTELSNKKAELGIVTIGLQVSTMDDVFLKVGELSHSPNEAAGAGNSPGAKGKMSSVRFKGMKLHVQQFWALLLKRIHYTTRRPMLLLLQFAFPLVMLLIAMIIFHLLYKAGAAPPPLEIKLSDYKDPITYYSQLDAEFGDSYAKVVGSSATKVKSVPTAIWKASQTDPWHYKWIYIVGAVETQTGVTAMFSPFILHAEPLSINLVSNAILQKLKPKSRYRIQVINHPIEFVAQEYNQKLDLSSLTWGFMAFTFFNKVGLSFFGAILIVFPLTERLCKAKHLQLMTGVNPILFWGTSLLWDNVIVWILGSLMVGLIALFQIDTQVSFSADCGLGVFFLAIICVGLGLVPFSYVCSLKAGGVTSGFIAVFLLHFLIENVFGFFLNFLPYFATIVPGWKGTAILYTWWTFYVALSLISPIFSVSHLMSLFARMATQHDHCRKYMENSRDTCVLGKGTTLRPSCCDNYKDFNKKGFPVEGLRKPYLSLILVGIPLGGEPGGPTVSLPGMGVDIILLCLSGIIYTLILFIVEYKAILKLIPKGSQPPTQQNLDNPATGPNQYAEAQIPYYQQQGGQQPIASPGAVGQAAQAPVPYQDARQQPPPYPNPGQPGAQYGAPPEPSYQDHLYRVIEEDVMQESNRVKELVEAGRASEDSLVVHDFSKQFDSFPAVANLSFGVHYGECFGLLGVNGAGKTTAFKMITGDEIPSGGTAYTHNYCLTKDPRHYLKSIGYCPQFDAFFEVFTGKQMLELYCRLRGVPAVSMEADRWMDLFGLSDSKNVQCMKYSGGMKRRLNAAAAMIGDPPVILFDEPTSGVDPIAQHLFWDIILSLRGSEQSVILTSHSMGECEALCSRLGIMVNGQFQCFGGVEHLKEKYGEGYTLFIKLKTSIDPDLITAMREEINTKFAPCVIKDQHQNIIQYQVMNTSMTYGEIFQATENLKSKFKDIIEEYSVNDMTLEEIFLTFARKQYDERPQIKKKCTCIQFLMCDFECKCEKCNN